MEYIQSLGIILLTVITEVYLACYVLSRVLKACLQPLEAHQTELLHLEKQKQNKREMNSKNKSFMICNLTLKFHNETRRNLTLMVPKSGLTPIFGQSLMYKRMTKGWNG